MIQVYHSIFAELIRDFIAYKRAAGYKYETEAVYLKTFDDLCFSLNIDSPKFTKELMDKWCEKKPYESARSCHQQPMKLIFQLTLNISDKGNRNILRISLPTRR